MAAFDAPLESARSQLSNDPLDGLLRGLYNKLALIGARAPIQDESSPHSPRSRFTGLQTHYKAYQVH